MKRFIRSCTAIESGLLLFTLTVVLVVSGAEAKATVAQAANVNSCIPDIPIPKAGNRSWPDSCTAGASGNLTNASADVVLDQAGQVYSNVRLDGTITVLACNVTIQNVEVDAGEPFIGNQTPDLFAIWLKEPPNCSVTLNHVSVITKPAPNIYVTNAIRVAYGGPVTIKSTKLVGIQIGITMGPGLVQARDRRLSAFHADRASWQVRD